MYGGPKITHLDDVPAEEMLRFQFKDGRTASIWEKWIEMSPRYTAFWNKWDPGAMTPPHGHHGDHINLILQGEISSSRGHVARTGSHIMLEYGDVFGPWVAGPEGAELYGFVAGEGSSYWADPSEWDAWLEKHEAVSMPVPMPKRLPHWWRDKMIGKGHVTNWVEE